VPIHPTAPYEHAHVVRRTSTSAESPSSFTQAWDCHKFYPILSMISGLKYGRVHIKYRNIFLLLGVEVTGNTSIIFFFMLLIV